MSRVIERPHQGRVARRHAVEVTFRLHTGCVPQARKAMIKEEQAIVVLHEKAARRSASEEHLLPGVMRPLCRTAFVHSQHVDPS